MSTSIIEYREAPASAIAIAVLMSGGLDSSAAASILLEQGYKVTSLTARLCDESCGTHSNVSENAKQVAAFLGIRHKVIDLRKPFKRLIIEPFLNEYAHGRTPSPCIRCNELIKFGLLMDEAIKMSFNYIATGHYVLRERKESLWYLLKGKDTEKDQSYFLHRLNQLQLGRSLFPLGEWTKNKVAKYVRDKGIPIKEKPESQDLCFINGSNYARFIEQHLPALKSSGPIMDKHGKRIGEHTGFYKYTLGQRYGIGISSKSRLYVLNIDAQSNTVVVGAREEGMSSACIVKDVNWLVPFHGNGNNCTVRLRSRHKGVQASISVCGAGAVKCFFSTRQFAVTPGQAAVFYDGKTLLGGGWLESSTA